MEEQPLERIWRAQLFEHLDGWALCGVMPPLAERGLFDELARAGAEGVELDLGGLAYAYQANEGYLNVALRMAAMQGWVERRQEGEGEGERVGEVGAVDRPRRGAESSANRRDACRFRVNSA